MPSKVIRGTVKSGSGRVSKVVVGERLEERRKAAKMQLVPGTLNVRVPNLGRALHVLGEPAMRTEHDSPKLGPLRWWPVTTVTHALKAPSFVIRHERGKAGFLEVVSDVNFREAGMKNGQNIELHTDAPQLVVSPPKPAAPAKPKPPKPAKPRRPVRAKVRQGRRTPDPLPPPEPCEVSPEVAYPELALIIGGGECVWDDVKALEDLYGREWDGLVIAVNDVGSHWSRRIDHWCTLHPEKLPNWARTREAKGFPGGFLTWGRKSHRTNRVIQPWGGGSSGLLGVAVAFALGCERIVLCGVPMTKTPHFAQSIVHQRGKNWNSSNSHWKAWSSVAIRDRMMGKVKSMSGRTQELLGAPTVAWLCGAREMKEAA